MQCIGTGRKSNIYAQNRISKRAWVMQYITELAEKASCSMYISENIELPPILLIHSEYDPIVSVENSRTLYEKLITSKHNVSYYELEESDAHGGAVYYDSEILDIIQEFCRKCLSC